MTDQPNPSDLAQLALKHVAERHPECDSPDTVLMVYPEIVAHQALAACALPPRLHARGRRTLDQALSQREREWQVHPVAIAEKVRDYLRIIQTICTELVTHSEGPQ